MIQGSHEDRLADQDGRSEGAFADAVIDATPGEFFVIDGQGRLVRWNRVFAETLGLTDDQLRGMNGLLAVCEEDRPLAATKVKETLDTGQAQGEMRVITRDGPKWYHITSRRMLIGDVPYIVGIGIDISERRRVEAALRESEQRLAMAQRAARLGVFDWDVASGRVVWSHELEELLGAPPGGFTGTFQDWISRVHPDDLPQIEAMRRRWATEHLEEFTSEYRMRRPDGEYRWMQVRGRVFYGPDGSIVRVLGTDADITDRKRAEDALRASESTSRALLSAVPDLMFRMHADGTYLDYVANNLDELYVPPNAFLGRKMAEVLPPDVAALLAECNKRALAGQVAVCEYLLPIKGENRYFEARAAACGPDQVLQIIRDITDRKRAEESALQAEVKFRRFVDGNVIGVIVTGRRQVFEANELFLETVGYSRADLEAGLVNWPDMTPPEHAHKDANAFVELLARGFCTPYEKEYVRKDGVRVPVLLGIALLEREPQRFIGFVLDLTQRKHAEQELKTLNESLEARVAERSEAVQRLLRELDHRMRNHLAGLIFLVDAMRQRARSVHAFADAIESRLWAMVSVHDLLAQSTWKAVDLESLVWSLFDLSRGLAIHRIHVEVQGPPVVVSPERVMPLSMILVEWFSNSCKYGAHTTAKGRLKVSWETAGANGQELVRLKWKEANGPQIVGPIKPSFGMELVRSFASRDLGGSCELTFPADGAAHTLEFPPA